MYKIYTRTVCTPPGYIKKFLLVMKITTFFLFAVLMQVSAAGLAQRLTLVQKDATLKQVFNEINKQTTYNIVWSASELNGDQKVNANFKDAPLMEVLNQCLQNTGLTYAIDDKTVVIKQKDATILDKIKSAFSPSSANISGTVTDSTSAPLVGATVILENTKYTTETDEEGKFTIQSVPNGKYHLVITYVGYKEYEVNVQVSGNDINFRKMSMIAAADQLKEVVVSNGYQALPLERATGSYDHIDNELLNRSTDPNILNRLKGIASGLLFNNVNVNQNNIGISIRGLSTIQSNATPLVILDNFPYAGNISNINPNDIESITILKDAAAASIWGAQAGNGVIVITSKKGHLNQPLKIEFNTNVTFSQKPNLYYNRNFLDANDYINVEEQLYSNGYYNSDLNQPGNPVATSPVVDLLNQESNGTITAGQANAKINALRNIDVRNQLSKYFYQSPVDQQYSLNLSSGSNGAAYFFSAGYDNDPSIQVGSGYQRITLNSQNTFTPVKNLEITAGITFTDGRSLADNTLNNLHQSSFQEGLFPYTQFAGANGVPLPILYSYTSEFVSSAPSQGYLNWQNAPLQELRDHDNVSTTNSYDIKTTAGIKYTILPGLSVNALYSNEKGLTNSLQDYTQESFNTRDLINQYSILNGSGQVAGYNIPLGNILHYNYNNLTSQDFRLQLNYSKEWKSNSLSLLGGYEVRDVPSIANGYTEYGYNPNNSTSGQIDPITEYVTNPYGVYGSIGNPLINSQTDNRFLSYFANGGYTYDGKYTLSVSARIDESNLFGVNFNNKIQPLWSSGFKWNISKENFYHLDWLNVLDARVTYGYQGNVNTSIYAVPIFLGHSDNFGYGTVTDFNLVSAGNPDLQWEKIGTSNFAVDFGLLNEKITGTFEYYFKSGTDLIGSALLPPSSGLESNTGNYSDMKGHGLDVTLNTKNIDGIFKWNTQFLFSYTTNEVTKYLGTSTAPTQIVIGKPVGALYAFKWAGLDPANGSPRGYLNGQISEDYDDLVKQPVTIAGNYFNSNSSWTYVGSQTPTEFGSIRNTFSYKNFSLSANIAFETGFYFQKSSISYTSLVNYGSGNVDFAKRWQKPGDEKTTNVPSMPDLNNLDGNRDAFYNESQAVYDNGSNIRFRDINFSYTLYKSQWHQLPFNNIQFYAYINNLGIIWRANKDHIDPDYSTTGIPQSRTIALGVKADF